MSARQGIHKWHRGESIKMIAKRIIHMYITAELNVCWLSYYLFIIYTGVNTL